MPAPLPSPRAASFWRLPWLCSRCVVSSRPGLEAHSEVCHVPQSACLRLTSGACPPRSLACLARKSFRWFQGISQQSVPCTAFLLVQEEEWSDFSVELQQSTRSVPCPACLCRKKGVTISLWSWSGQLDQSLALLACAGRRGERLCCGAAAVNQGHSAAAGPHTSSGGSGAACGPGERCGAPGGPPGGGPQSQLAEPGDCPDAVATMLFLLLPSSMVLHHGLCMGHHAERP